MPIEVKLPQISEGVKEVEIGDVQVAVGDTVKVGDPLMQVQADKAATSVDSQHAGTIKELKVKAGDKVAIGAVLLVMEATAGGKSEGEGKQPAAGKPDKGPEKKAPTEDKPAKAKTESAPTPTGKGKRVQLVVLGGGPGGYPAAFAAADHGLEVVLVDDDIKPGGVCLHRGCIPSKALLHVAKLVNEARHASQWGLTFAEPEIDLDKLRSFKEGVVKQLTGGIGQLGTARGVTMIRARGSFVNSNTLELTDPDGKKSTLEFEKCIIATGSSPTMPPVFKLNDPRVMDSTGALELPDIPKKLLVVGGGYIGLEMGSVYAALGSKVTVVEMTPGLLPGADRDLVKPLQKKLEEQFDKILLNTKVAALKAENDGIRVDLEGEGVESPQKFDRVLISIGRRPNSKGFGLENTKVKIDAKGFITVDAKQQTDDPALLAIGDVAGEPMLAHKATREAKVAIEALVGEPAEFDNVAIPAVVFTDPEVAWCGLTETQAKEQGIEVKVTKFPWAASGRAQAISRTEGLTKLLFDPKTERLLGVGIVGAGAGELIGEAVIAVESAAVARDLADSIHAHPTLSETLMEAAEAEFGQATHYFLGKKKK